MRITIIDADRPDPEVRHRWPSYAGMCAQWLGPALPEARFSSVNVSEGNPFPDLASFDAVLLTGSRAGAYEDHPWIAPYIDFLRRCRDVGRPVGGICFGHQIMATAFGGTVERSARGWAIGRHHHVLTEAGRAVFPDTAEISALSFHQDQVVSLPPGAHVLLGNDHSPHGALRYGHPALSVQFHPEFGADYLAGLLDRLPPDAVPRDLARASRTGLDLPIDNAKVAAAFAMFYRSHCGKADCGRPEVQTP